VKAWQVIFLGLSILVGCGTVAIVDGVKDRYHYTAYTVFNLPTRVDRYSGEVEVYDKTFGGWTNAATWKAK
jgi:hypothetical protein